MPDFAPATKAALLPLMQDGIAPSNPLDVGIPSTLEVAADLCTIAVRDPDVDMVAWAAPMPRRADAWGDVTPLRQLLERTDKPVVAFARIAAQQAAGFPFLQGIEPTVRALNGLWFHAARAGRRPAAAALAGCGIALPRSEAVASADEAAAAAERIGFPVALKIRSPDIVHKTEAAGVALDLRDRAAVISAADMLAASALAARPDARIDGFLVQEMVTGVEAIVGARSDPHYGPLLLIGAGGVLVELAEDAALRLLPATPSDIGAMLDGLALTRLLAGFRGRPPADRGALEAAAVALGQFFLDHRARIAEIEINPLMVRAAREGAAAVDVRAVWRDDVRGA